MNKSNRSIDGETPAESFNRKSDAYRYSRIHREGEDLQQVIDWMDGCDRVLDVATGAGHVAGGTRRAGSRFVVALDPAPSMVRIALQDYPGLFGVLSNAEELPICSQCFDAVTCRLGAHHFEDPERFLSESRRILVPGGSLVLVDNIVPEDPELDHFMNQVERLRDPTHGRLYSASRWTTWLEGLGMKVAELRVIRRTIDYDTWIQNQDPAPEVEQQIRSRLLDAPDRAREAFGIRGGQKTVHFFDLPTIMVRAVA